jgi:hypothetical protein
MGRLDFLKTRSFLKGYFLITLLILISTLVFNLLGMGGDGLLQTIAGLVTILSFALIMGAIFLTLAIVDRTDGLGRVVLRLCYATLIVLCIGLLCIMGSTFAFAMTPGGDNLLLVMIGLNASVLSGSFLSLIAYWTLSVDGAWLILKADKKIEAKKEN